MLIYLIGFMGSGKTTVGRKLAKKMGYKFLDTDQMIEEQTGFSVSEIFNLKGETYFREMEKLTLTQTLQYNNHIISTGGGMPCYYDNMQCMLDHGTVIYLKMSPNALYQRIVNSRKERPLFANLTREQTQERIASLLSEREKYYEKAHTKLDALSLDINSMVV
ncbi:MAG: shikimate kinase [Bacteroidetes bacterium]|nr:shikimate kinase [Bacteroidota bacterium]